MRTTKARPSQTMKLTVPSTPPMPGTLPSPGMVTSGMRWTSGVPLSP